MATMNMIQALNDAHKVAMRADDDIVVFGEDIGYFGGVFRVTEGLQKQFGKTRVFDAPISEGGIVATAVGMATYGLKPRRRDPVRRLHLSRLRPDRQRGRQDPLSHRGRMDDADGHPHALWRRHFRRPDPQPERPKACSPTSPA